MANLVKTVDENVLKNGMIVEGDKILIAFSGGPDSTALLHVLSKLSKRRHFALAACYINHNIRPQAIKKEIKFCSNYCNRLKIPFLVMEANIPKIAREMKLSVEEAGRIFRKKALAVAAKEQKCAKIAFGHHLDDTVETILFRLFRGTGPQGLDPLKPVSDKIIRPFYNVTRKDIEQYLRKNRISWILDESNLQSQYSRNYIRNRIIPVIEKHFSSQYRKSLVNFASILTEEDGFLRRLTEAELKKCAAITPGGKIIVDLKNMRAYDVWLRRRLVKLILENLSGHPGAGAFEEIERVEAVINGKLKATNLPSNIKAARDRDYLFFYNRKTLIGNKELDSSGITLIPGLNSILRYSIIALDSAVTKTQEGGRKINLDHNKILPPLCVRAIKPGDSFSPLGMRGAKKIGDFLTDKKIPRFIRDEIPVIADQNGVVWLVGHQISDRVKIDKTTRQVMEIEISREKAAESPEV